MREKNFPASCWDIEYGGQSKEALLYLLASHKIGMNAFASLLFLNPEFTLAPEPQTATVIETSVAALGLAQGAIYSEIIAAAKQLDLSICPLEVAVYLRLQYLEQAEGVYLTVASKKLRVSEEYPNGFYLSCKQGQLWLRGYRASADWHWPPDSCFAFLKRRKE